MGRAEVSETLCIGCNNCTSLVGSFCRMDEIMHTGFLASSVCPSEGVTWSLLRSHVTAKSASVVADGTQGLSWV